MTHTVIYRMTLDWNNNDRRITIRRTTNNHDDRLATPVCLTISLADLMIVNISMSHFHVQLLLFSCGLEYVA